MLIYREAVAKYKSDAMLCKVFNADSSWYNRETKRIECDEELMFFGV
jgi:hypothetical protein